MHTIQFKLAPAQSLGSIWDSSSLLQLLVPWVRHSYDFAWDNDWSSRAWLTLLTEWGLLQVLVCGAELFTSNTAMLPAALIERRARFSQLVRNWAIAYSGNPLYPPPPLLFLNPCFEGRSCMIA